MPNFSQIEPIHQRITVVAGSFGDQERLMRRSVVISLVLLAIAFTFAVIAFSNAANSTVPVLLVAVYMVISSLVFGVLAYRGLRSRDRLSRFLGVIAVVGAIYMLGFAVFSLVVLPITVMPF
jgi:hypothetical protein